MQEIEPKLKVILEMPTTVDNIHQSIFRANSILMYILEMVERGDSKETIWDVYYLLSGDKFECEIKYSKFDNQTITGVPDQPPEQKEGE